MKKIKDYTYEEVTTALEGTSSIKEFLVNIGLPVNNGNYRRAKQIVAQFGLELNKHDSTNNGIMLRNFNRMPIEKFFTDGVLRTGSHLKKRMIEDFGVEDKCAECSLAPFWNGKPLTLQVDHIDGDRFNNRIENLRILCPNCHTQTETYGNNRGEKTYSYCSCGVRIHKKSKSCSPCAAKASIGMGSKIEYPPVSELISQVEAKGYLALGRELGVSDNAIRKHLKARGVNPLPKRVKRKA